MGETRDESFREGWGRLFNQRRKSLLAYLPGIGLPLAAAVMIGSTNGVVVGCGLFLAGLLGSALLVFRDQRNAARKERNDARRRVDELERATKEPTRLERFQALLSDAASQGRALRWGQGTAGVDAAEAWAVDLMLFVRRFLLAGKAIANRVNPLVSDRRAQQHMERILGDLADWRRNLAATDLADGPLPESWEAWRALPVAQKQP